MSILLTISHWLPAAIVAALAVAAYWSERPGRRYLRFPFLIVCAGVVGAIWGILHG